MRSKTAELLIVQYGRRPVSRPAQARAAPESHPFGPRKRAFYALLVPVTAPRH